GQEDAGEVEGNLVVFEGVAGHQDALADCKGASLSIYWREVEWCVPITSLGYSWRVCNTITISTCSVTR
ncbi:hypothetical protein ACM9HO_16615, partial [Pseudomonas sp. KHB2.9]